MKWYDSRKKQESGSATLAGLTDVDLNNLADGQILVWDNTANKWINADNQGGGSGGTDKALVLKTKTYTGDGNSSYTLTLDDNPVMLWFSGEGGDNSTVTSYSTPIQTGVLHGDWFKLNGAGSLEGGRLSYDSSTKTLSVSGGSGDMGVIYNYNGGAYTLYYIVEEEVGGSASWVDIIGTLTAGQTSVTLSNGNILTSSTINIYADVFGVSPTNVEVTTGSITLTFEEQSENLGVKVRITNSEPTHTIYLDRLAEGKIWAFYDSNDNPVCSYPAEATSNGLYIRGGETLNNWTTFSAIGIDTAYFTLPNNPTSLKVHFSSLDLTNYGGFSILSLSTKKEGAKKGDGTVFSNTRLYTKTAENGAVSETDYTITVDLTGVTLNQYLYLVVCTGMTESQTTGYNDGRNGTESAVIDWVDIE